VRQDALAFSAGAQLKVFLPGKVDIERDKTLQDVQFECFPTEVGVVVSVPLSAFPTQTPSGNSVENSEAILLRDELQLSQKQLHQFWVLSVAMSELLSLLGNDCAGARVSWRFRNSKHCRCQSSILLALSVPSIGGAVNR
jgi:hypothetical protein